MISKTDMDAAYYHIHENSGILSTWIAIVENLTLLCLRLPLITTPALTDYTTVRKSEMDLGNDILRYKLWYVTGIKSPQI